jgi:hypothetical protein
MGFRPRRPAAGFIIAGGILGGIAIAGLIFSLRAPVVLVGDAPFAGLYGRGRSILKQAGLSLRFFRPVTPVILGESAGPDMAALAVEESSPAPYAVFFPYRYSEGARLYGEKNPEIPVFVLGGRGLPGQEGEGPVFLPTDLEADYYRAGLAAALFAGERPGRVLLFQDGAVSPAGEQAFIRGLREGGFWEAPLFLGRALHSCGVESGVELAR